MIARINLQESIILLGHKTDEEITLWGRDSLLRIPPINSVGDELLLLVILNLLGIEFLFAKGKNFAGDDLSVAASLGITC